jgi:sugar lactone lactonase YvrE
VYSALVGDAASYGRKAGVVWSAPAALAAAVLGCGARSAIDGFEPVAVDAGVQRSADADVQDGRPLDDAAQGVDARASCPGPSGVRVLANEPRTTRIGYAIAANAESVFWLESGPALEGSDLVLSVPICGGAVVTLATQQAYVNEIAVDEANVYWTNASSEDDGTVMRVSVHGGDPVTLASGGNPGGIAVDDTSVYWTDRSRDAVMMLPKSGGAAVTLAPRQVSPDALAINATHVCWVVDGNASDEGPDVTPAAVACVSKGGGQVVGITSGAALYAWLAMDETTVYSTPGDGSGVASVTATPIESGPSITLGGGSPAGIAVDATSVYWTDSPEQSGMGTVIRVPKAGGATATLASAQAIPGGVTTSGGYVLWTNDPESTGPGPAILAAPE